MPIIDIQRRLHEAGRIRIGSVVEGETKAGKKYTRPDKLENFRFTSTNEVAIKEIATLYGGEVKPWADAPVGKQWEVITMSSTIRVLVPPEAMSFSQYYELWSGGGCKRRCNGAFQVPSEDDCVCDPNDRECKPHTRLSIMLEGLPGAGLWRLDTQGWNAGVEIGGAFELAQLISRATGKAIIPGTLRLDQRESKREGETVKKFAVPVLDFDVDMGAFARGSELSGVTPIPAIETRSFADEITEVEHVERKTRSNSAEPIKPTGIAPKTRGVMVDDDGVIIQNDADPATAEELSKLNDAYKMLVVEEKRIVKAKWAELGITTPRSKVEYEKAYQVIFDVINAVSDDPADDEQDGENGPSSVSEGQEMSTRKNTDDIFPPLLTSRQVTGINTRAAKLGFADRAAVHSRISQIIGKECTSVKNLLKSEAMKVIDQFEADLDALK